MRFCVELERPYYQPGQLLEGQLTCDSVDVDYVEGRIFGEAELCFQKGSSCSSRVLVDERVELWRYFTLNQLLGLDENRNENSACFSKSEATKRFPIRLQIPNFAPPTFQCSGSGITVRYVLEITLQNHGKIIGTHEEPIIILGNQPKSRKSPKSPLSFSKTFHFSKERSIFAEIVLKTDVFSTTDKIDATINVLNNWKQSLKYVHLNVVRRISALNFENQVVEEVKIDTTGVGLPSIKHKIAVGETYTFRPTFNIPALPPNIKVDGLFQTEYSLKLSIGRAHNFILSSFEIPINITTNELKSCRDSILVDISSSSSSINNINLL